MINIEDVDEACAEIVYTERMRQQFPSQFENRVSLHPRLGLGNVLHWDELPPAEQEKEKKIAAKLVEYLNKHLELKQVINTVASNKDSPKKVEEVDHPQHYGGADDPYEAIKVIEAWGLGFSLGNCIKYISRHGKKLGSSAVKDLRKAAWYLNRAIANIESKQP